jgi:hypothetical protein
LAASAPGVLWAKAAGEAAASSMQRAANGAPGGMSLELRFEIADPPKDLMSLACSQ